MEVKELDVQSFSKRYVNDEHPALIITKPSNACVPVLQNCLYHGNLPLIIERNGERKLIRRMSESAYNVQALLLVCSGILYVDKDDKEHIINTVEDYLEVFN